MIIKDRGITKEVTQKQYNNKYKDLGYEIVEKKKKINDMTKDELYELAQKQQIEGRSEMSKAELLEALKEVV